MNLFITRADAKHHEKVEIDNNTQYLSHGDELVDFYQKYKDDEFTPNNGEKNSRNLFDDYDTEDKKWLNIAKKYLRNV